MKTTVVYLYTIYNYNEKNNEKKILTSNKIKKLTYKAMFYDYYTEKCGV